MRILPTLSLLLAVLVGAGCASPPPQAEVDAAAYGPAPITFRSEVREALARKLFDPPSAQLRFGDPFRAAVENGDFGDGFGGGYATGWVVPVGVKARRADGEYSRFLPRRFFFPTGGGVFELHDEQDVIPADAGVR